MQELGWLAHRRPDRASLPLFHLPKLHRAGDLSDPSSEPVFVVEGEKMCLHLETLDLLATTSAHGSKSSARTDWSPLAGR